MLRIKSFDCIINSHVFIVFILLSQILSTRLLGKRTNLKLKTVTIIHSATTETVRLPDDNNGVNIDIIIEKCVNINLMLIIFVCFAS